MPAGRSHNFVFAEFELRREELGLLRNGERIRLQIQPFRVLEVLLEHAGKVVTREELRARVWQSNVYVDFDHGLNNAIARLREVLGDSADSPRFIETQHRIGYRFIHPIELRAVPAPQSGAQPTLIEPASDRSDVDTESQAAESGTARSRRPALRLAVGALLLSIATFGILTAVNRGGDSPANTPIRSLAVLPFRDMSDGDEQDYFAAGMTQVLTTRLAQDRSLRVVSRQAAARYHDTETSIAEVARDLQVDGVIDGSIARRGDRVRIDIQLVRAADESLVWAHSYERSIRDIFLLQRELADDVSTQIQGDIGGKATNPVSLARSDNVEAYDLYLRGRHLWNQRNPQSVSKSIDYFQKAIELDPDFAAAYAGLAFAYSTIGGNTLLKSMSADAVRPAAIAAARRAIELDNGLADAHLAIARVLSLFQHSRETDLEIEQEYLLALRLDPASADARHGYGNFLSNRRRSDEAIAQYREAMLLEPLSPNIVGRLGMELAANGQVEEGMDLMRRAVEIEPWQFNAHLRLGWAYATFDQFEEANKQFEIAEQISPGSARALAFKSYVAARIGDTARVVALLEELRAQADAADDPFLVAIVYVGLQDRDGALEWLEKAASSKNTDFLGKVGLFGLDSPIYDWLRADPQFERIRQLVELADLNPHS